MHALWTFRSTAVFVTLLALGFGVSVGTAAAETPISEDELLKGAILHVEREDWVKVAEYLFAYTSRGPRAMRVDPDFAWKIRDNLAKAERNVRFASAGSAGASGQMDELGIRRVEIPKPPNVGSSHDTRAEGVLCQMTIRPARNNRLCMHKKSNGWANGNVIHLWDCADGGKANKVWIFEPATGLIRNAVNPSVCLHKKYPGWADGNPVHLWDCDAGSPEMKTWRYDSAAGLIRSAVNPRMCLHKQSSGWENGNIVHLWECGAGDVAFKSWRLTPSP